MVPKHYFLKHCSQNGLSSFPSRTSLFQNYSHLCLHILVTNRSYMSCWSYPGTPSPFDIFWSLSTTISLSEATFMSLLKSCILIFSPDNHVFSNFLWVTMPFYLAFWYCLLTRLINKFLCIKWQKKLPLLCNSPAEFKLVTCWPVSPNLFFLLAHCR